MKNPFTNNPENTKRAYKNNNTFSQSSFSKRRFNDNKEGFTPKEGFAKRRFSDNKEGFAPKEGFAKRRFGDNKEGFAPKEGFAKRRFNDNKEGFAPREGFAKRRFNDNKEGFASKEGFAKRRFNDNKEGFASKEGFAKRRFSDNKEGFTPKEGFAKRRFGDNKEGNGNFKTKTFNQDKKHFNKNSSISVEYILNIISNSNGSINLAQLNLQPKEHKEALHKIELLNKFNLLTTKDNNHYTFVTYEIMHGLPKFVVISNLKKLEKNNYIVTIKNITNKVLDDNNIIINNVKEIQPHQEILVELTKDKEKIIASPLLYLNSKNLITPSNNTPTTPLNEITGIAKFYDNNFYIIPLNYKTKVHISLVGYNNTVQDSYVIKAKLINNITAEYIETIAIEKQATKLSMLSVYQYNLPAVFSQDALDEANNIPEWSLDNRKDITHLPLITIDDEDAKDFDDAIWAEQISSSPVKYKLYVAIADVSSCVLPNSHLDKEAKQRGNSVYLPGFVIPMLPHRLSNNLCSLNPNINTGCMLAEIIINHNGEVEEYSFSKAIMKSKARLTYNLLQNAIDNNFELNKITQPNVENISINKVSNITEELLKDTISPIYNAFLLLQIASKKRKPLEIQSKETKIILDNEDNILDIISKTQNTANKIVEEFMVIANVCSAKFLAKNNVSNLAVYRIHDKPSVEKLNEFGNILKSFAIYKKIPENPNGEFFNTLIAENSTEWFINSLNENILRTQAQAVYSTYNIGHYGLGLKEYCHFTSPIRRYADLMVHRLINSILDKNITFNYHQANVQEISDHISKTERTAFLAEIASKERILTNWLKNKIGTQFNAQVSSITKAGIFVNLLTINVSGLIPMRLISTRYAKYNFNKNTITNPDNNHTYKLGENITVTLFEADEYKGLLTFSIVSNNTNKKKRYR